jgi:MFS family permease
MPASPARRAGVTLSAQRRVFASFFLYAFGFGGFFPRLGELQRSMGISESELGFGLTGTACGTLLSLSLGSRWIERVGHRRTLLALVPAVPLLYAIASWASGPLALFLLLLPAGVCIGAIELVVNLEADRVEHQGARRIMNRAHAFWSFGFFGAGLLGALAARVGIGAQAQLALIVPLVLGLTALLLGRFDAAPPRSDTPAEAPPRFARPTPAILLLVALSLSALVLEGAAFDWSAIYMRDVFSAAPFIGGLAVASGALTQAVTRYFADPFVERHSPAVVARTLLVLLGIGAALVTFAATPTVALLGFGLMGVGTSVLFPLAMSAAAQRTDRAASANVASLAQISFVSFLLAPPLLGLVAEHWGVRTSFGIGLPLVMVSLLASGALAHKAAQRSGVR